MDLEEEGKRQELLPLLERAMDHFAYTIAENQLGIVALGLDADNGLATDNLTLVTCMNKYFILRTFVPMSSVVLPFPLREAKQGQAQALGRDGLEQVIEHPLLKGLQGIPPLGCDENDGDRARYFINPGQGRFGLDQGIAKNGVGLLLLKGLAHFPKVLHLGQHLNGRKGDQLFFQDSAVRLPCIQDKDMERTGGHGLIYRRSANREQP